MKGAKIDEAHVGLGPLFCQAEMYSKLKRRGTSGVKTDQCERRRFESKFNYLIPYLMITDNI